MFWCEKWIGSPQVASLLNAPSCNIANGAVAQPLVQVKVGDGEEYLLKHVDLADMDVISLLEALVKHSGFRTRMAGVSLDECTVRVVKSKETAPTPQEEGNAVQLVSAMNLAQLVEAGKNLFVRVQLPLSAVGGKFVCVCVWRACSRLRSCI